MAKVIGISPQTPKASTTAYDPTCAQAPLLLKVADNRAREHDQARRSRVTRHGGMELPQADDAKAKERKRQSHDKSKRGQRNKPR